MPKKRSKSIIAKKNKKIEKWKNKGAKSNSSTNPNRIVKGNRPDMRSKSKIRLLNMYWEKVDEAERRKEKGGV